MKPCPTRRSQLLLFLILLVGASSASAQKLTLEEGLGYLQRGDYASAAVVLYKIKHDEKLDEPTRCQAAYGHFLSLYADLMRYFASATALGSSSLINEQVQMNVTSAYSILNMMMVAMLPLGGILDGLGPTLTQRYFGPAAESAEYAAQVGCTLTLEEGLPLFVTRDPARLVYVGKRFTPPVARLAAGVSYTLLGLVETLNRFELNIDLRRVLEGLDLDLFLNMASKDPVAAMRYLAVIPHRAPTFLAFKQPVAYPLREPAEHLAKGLRLLAEGTEAFFSPANAYKEGDALAYHDKDGDGKLSSGDAILEGIVKTQGPFPYQGNMLMLKVEVDPQPPVKELGGGPMGFLLKLVMKPAYIRKLARTLKRVADNLEGKDEGLMPLSELNNIIPIPAKIFPETVAVDLSAFFLAKNPPPLTGFFPAYGFLVEEGRQTLPQMLIEVEVQKPEQRGWNPSSGAEPPPALSAVNLRPWVDVPGPRFSDPFYTDETRFKLPPGLKIEPIPNDCVDPKEGEEILYAYLADPSFGGMVYVDLESVKDTGPCAAQDGASSFGGFGKAKPRGSIPPPSLYALNKAFALWSRDVAALFEMMKGFMGEGGGGD